MLPCGECPHCRRIFALGFEGMLFAVPVRSHKNSDEMIDLVNKVLDEMRKEPFHVISSTSPVSVPIRMARDIKKSLSRKGSEGITRVALFHRMETMKFSSADALLKLIEEPPDDTVIILTADNPEALLPTIQSRSQKIRIERTPEIPGVEYLMSNYDVSQERARLVTRISQGNIGRSLALINDVNDGESSRRATGFWLFRSLFTETNASAVALSMELLDSRDRSAVEELLTFWQSLARDCSYYAETGDDETLVNIDFAVELKKIARFFEESEQVVYMTECIKNALADLALNVHIQTALASLILKLKLRIPILE